MLTRCPAFISPFLGEGRCVGVVKVLPVGNFLALPKRQDAHFGCLHFEADFVIGLKPTQPDRRTL
jgi:hypothetical protein